MAIKQYILDDDGNLMNLERVTREDLDWFSQLIAGHLAEHGVERTITQDILQERCRHYTEVAKQELAALGPEENPDSSDYRAMATVFTAGGNEASSVPVGWRTGDKRRMMHALSETCKTILAQAVIIRHVATISNMEKIAGAMQLNMPDPRNRQKMAYFEERMWKWITANYGRARLSALPPEFRRDCIMVAGMGPKLHDAGVLTVYRWENGKLVFEDATEGGDSRLDLIPRWWQ